MVRFALVGTSTPLIKTIERIGALEGLCLPVLYTEMNRAGEVHRLCAESGIEIRDIALLASPDAVNELSAVEPDWLLSISSPMILSADILQVPKGGSLNMHPGRLPDYAGMHAHQWAIRNGEKRFAATVHWMEPAVDAGPICYMEEFDITPDDTGFTVLVKCLNAGSRALLRCLSDILEDRVPPKNPQDLGRRHLYRHRDALDGRVDWSWPARRIVDFVRAADYGPFQSPTYVPSASGPRGRFHVRKAEVVGAFSEQAGTVVQIDDSGVVIAAGDGSCVRLRSVDIPSGDRARGAAVAEALGLRPGDRLDAQTASEPVICTP